MACYEISSWLVAVNMKSLRCMQGSPTQEQLTWRCRGILAAPARLKANHRRWEHALLGLLRGWSGPQRPKSQQKKGTRQTLAPPAPAATRSQTRATAEVKNKAGACWPPTAQALAWQGSHQEGARHAAHRAGCVMAWGEPSMAQPDLQCLLCTARTRGSFQGSRTDMCSCGVTERRRQGHRQATPLPEPATSPNIATAWCRPPSSCTLRCPYKRTVGATRSRHLGC